MAEMFNTFCSTHSSISSSSKSGINYSSLCFYVCIFTVARNQLDFHRGFLWRLQLASIGNRIKLVSNIYRQVGSFITFGYFWIWLYCLNSSGWEIGGAHIIGSSASLIWEHQCLVSIVRYVPSMVQRYCTRWALMCRTRNRFLAYSWRCYTDINTRTPYFSTHRTSIWKFRSIHFFWWPSHVILCMRMLDRDEWVQQW
jgi:hypothetical protein